MAVLITGASGFIGGAIAERLLGRAELRGLTNHPAKNRFAGRITNFSYDFESPDRMAAAFDGADVFVNTYYIRFNYGPARFERAVEQSKVLVDLARSRGVRKIVHVSVSNASESSDLPYYANKARIERLVRESGLDYTILRPAIVVGAGDILVNNIAYFLRHVPVFTIFGRGDYRVQPITLDAFGDIAVAAIDGEYGASTVAVAGPRDFSFLELVREVRRAVGSRAAMVHAPAWVALTGLTVAGWLLRDVVLTRDEVRGLVEEYLYSDQPVRRGADFSDWLAEPATSDLGVRYASELARHFR
ncbi:MAG TPA: NAD(P)H-binding protein [Vicinamibacterales bacterium]